MTTQWKRYLAWGDETTYGEAATTSNKIDIVSESLTMKIKRDEVQPDRFGAVRRVVEQTRSVESGTIDIVPSFAALEDWLTWLVGAPTETEPYAGVRLLTYYYRPRYVIGSRTLDLHPDTEIFRCLGAIGRTLRLSPEATRPLVLSVGILAKKILPAGTIPSIVGSAFPQPFHLGGDAEFSNEITFGEHPADASGQIAYDWQWSRKLRMPARYDSPMGIIDTGKVRMGGSLRYRWDGDTSARYEAWRSGQRVQVTSTWTGAQITGAYYESLIIDVPNAYIPNIRPPSVRGPGGLGTLDIDIEFSALAYFSAPYRGSPFRIRLMLPALE